MAHVPFYNYLCIFDILVNIVIDILAYIIKDSLSKRNNLIFILLYKYLCICDITDNIFSRNISLNNYCNDH